MNLNLLLVTLNYWLYFILTVTFDAITEPSEQPSICSFSLQDHQSGSPRISTMGKSGWTGCVRSHKDKLSYVGGKEVVSAVMVSLNLSEN